MNKQELLTELRMIHKLCEDGYEASTAPELVVEDLIKKIEAEKPKCAAFRIVDHGIKHEQYFQGHGVSCTGYSHCVTGCDNNFQDALEDALDMASLYVVEQEMEEGASIDIDDLEQRICAEQGWKTIADAPTKPCVTESDDHHYYVSIDWK